MAYVTTGVWFEKIYQYNTRTHFRDKKKITTRDSINVTQLFAAWKHDTKQTLSIMDNGKHQTGGGHQKNKTDIDISSDNGRNNILEVRCIPR